MGIWSKILGGLEVFFKGVAADISMITTGVGAGAVFGPVGMAVGGLIGATIGSISGAYHLASYITDSIEPDGKEINTRLSGQYASQTLQIAHSGALGADAQKVSRGFIAAVQAGSTVRSAMMSAGGNQFNGAMMAGGIMSQANKASAEFGTHPITAMALGNGALKSQLAGSSQYMRSLATQHIYSSVAPLIGAMRNPSGGFGINIGQPVAASSAM